MRKSHTGHLKLHVTAGNADALTYVAALQELLRDARGWR